MHNFLYHILHKMYMCSRKNGNGCNNSMMFFGNCDCCRMLFHWQFALCVCVCVRMRSRAAMPATAAQILKEKWPFVVDRKRFRHEKSNDRCSFLGRITITRTLCMRARPNHHTIIRSMKNVCSLYFPLPKWAAYTSLLLQCLCFHNIWVCHIYYYGHVSIELKSVIGNIAIRQPLTKSKNENRHSVSHTHIHSPW